MRTRLRRFSLNISPRTFPVAPFHDNPPRPRSTTLRHGVFRSCPTFSFFVFLVLAAFFHVPFTVRARRPRPFQCRICAVRRSGASSARRNTSTWTGSSTRDADRMATTTTKRRRVTNTYGPYCCSRRAICRSWSTAKQRTYVYIKRYA